MNLKDKRILLTGGNGFLGKVVCKKLLERGVPRENIFIPKREDYDLRRETYLWKLFKDFPKPNIVIHLAANVGGIGYNLKYPANLFYDNLIMGIQLMEYSRQEGVEKFVSVGTVCSYPKNCPTPFKEEDLWNGYPEETNAPYGLAKKMLLVQSQAYRKQWNFNSIFLIPVNLYGPGDNFNFESSHVIPALIDKIEMAKLGQDLIIWGTGEPTREFLYVDDAAEGIVLATENYDSPEPVNLGTGKEISIKQLVGLLTHILDYNGSVMWDFNKPDGQPRRCLDTSKAKEFGFEAKMDFKEGLKKMIEGRGQ